MTQIIRKTAYTKIIADSGQTFELWEDGNEQYAGVESWTLYNTTGERFDQIERDYTPDGLTEAEWLDVRMVAADIGAKRFIELHR